MPQPGLQQPGGQSSIAAPSLLLPGDARGGVVWTPASLPGLVLWLDASSVGQPDNTAVARWTDQSGQGNHAVQGTVAAQPTYLAAGMAGAPAVRFDGVDDHLDAPDAPSLDVAGVTVYAVFSPATVAASFATLVAKLQSATWSSPYASYLLRMQLASPTGWVSGDADVLFGSSRAAGVPVIVGYVHSVAGVATLAVNGVVTTGVGTHAIGSAAQPLRLGANAAVGDCYSGALACALVYNRGLAPGERHVLEAYLAARYSIPVAQQ